jgi:hypothetical protein
MSIFRQKGEQYKSKIKVGSLDEEYLDKGELTLARKSIMKYKLRDPGPSVYRRKRNET